MPAPIDVMLTQGPDGAKLSFSCPDKSSQVPLADLLPALRTLANRVVEAAVHRETAAGRSISCEAGCGACCRQLVPLSATEARQLASVIAGLDEAHRLRVMARFEEARTRLMAAGLWERLDGLYALPPDQRSALSMQYFSQGIACPFLEDESCSIHPDRPLICRQYLVTSPAAQCRNPRPQTIVRVALAANVQKALIRIEAREAATPALWALIRAPFLADGAGEEPARTVPDWMRRLLSQIRRINEENIAQLQQGEDPFAANNGP